MEFEVKTAVVDGCRVLRVWGELDLDTAGLLTHAVQSEIADLTGTEQASPTARPARSSPAPLIIDLTETAFMDSSGARSLVHAARAAARHGVTLSLACPADNTRVRRVADLLHLSAIVPITETVRHPGEASA